MSRHHRAQPSRRAWRTSVIATWILVLTTMAQALLIARGVERVRDIGHAFEAVVERWLPAAQLARDMQTAAQNRIIHLLRMAAEPDPLAREDDARAFEREGLAFGQARDALTALALDTEGQQRLEAVLAHAVQLSKAQRRAVEALLLGQDDVARAIMDTERVLEQQRALVGELAQFVQWMGEHVRREQQAVQAEQTAVLRTLLMLGVSIFGFGLAAGFVVAKVIRRAEDVLHAEREKAERAAHTDALTGLLNRRGFECAQQQWRRTAQPGEVHALLLIDLDRFKPINDEAGHDAGDAALRRIAALMRDHVRPQDAVARLGGDEFAILLHRRDAAQAVAVAERLRDAIAGLGFEWGDRRFSLGASIGVAAFDAGHTADDDWSRVLKAADDACYRAKRAGRNQVVCAGETSATEAAGEPSSVMR